MASDVSLVRLVLTGAIFLLVAGGVTAWISISVGKRLVGVVIAQIGAALALAALHAPSQALIAGLVVAFVQLTLGVALLVRLQESYGATEVVEIDGGDGQSEPPEPLS